MIFPVCSFAVVDKMTTRKAQELDVETADDVPEPTPKPDYKSIIHRTISSIADNVNIDMR